MNLRGQIARFALVGGLAAACHLAILGCLVAAGIRPLVANAAAFAFAFQVSYFGHGFLTFRAKADPRGYARMLTGSLLCLAGNEMLFALLLHFTRIDYRVSQVLVLLVISVLSFLLSRGWVFKPDRKP